MVVTFPRFAWLTICCLATAKVVAQSAGDPLGSCTQTDPALLDACVASAVDQFLTTYNTFSSTSFDYNSVASEINSIQSGLTSFNITITSSLPKPSTFTGASTFTGPYVSDIVNSHSGLTVAKTTTTGLESSSLGTSTFTATTGPLNSQTTSSPSSTNSGAAMTTAAGTSDADQIATFLGHFNTGLIVTGFCMIGGVIFLLYVIMNGDDGHVAHPENRRVKRS